MRVAGEGDNLPGTAAVGNEVLVWLLKSKNQPRPPGSHQSSRFSEPTIRNRLQAVQQPISPSRVQRRDIRARYAWRPGKLETTVDDHRRRFQEVAEMARDGGIITSSPHKRPTRRTTDLQADWLRTKLAPHRYRGKYIIVGPPVAGQPSTRRSRPSMGNAVVEPCSVALADDLRSGTLAGASLRVGFAETGSEDWETKSMPSPPSPWTEKTNPVAAAYDRHPRNTPSKLMR